MMKTDITVRHLLTGEAHAAAKLECEAFGDPWSEVDLAAMADSESYILLCAVSNGICLGYMAASCVAGESELLRITSSPKARRRGIGGMLLDHFINERTAAGDTMVFLEVRASNTPAILLYRSRGFEEYAVRRNYYKAPVEDALMMRLDLTDIRHL